MSDVDTLKLIGQLRFIRDYECKTDDEVKTVNEAIKRLSAKRKTGWWIDTGSGQECSECHEIQYGYDSGRFYCQNCGAKMEAKYDK